MEGPSLHNRPLVVERRSLRSGLRPSVETTGIAMTGYPLYLLGRLGQFALVVFIGINIAFIVTHLRANRINQYWSIARTIVASNN